MSPKDDGKISTKSPNLEKRKKKNAKPKTKTLPGKKSKGCARKQKMVQN